MSQNLSVVESNNNYYPVYYNIYMIQCMSVKKSNIKNIRIKNVN